MSNANKGDIFALVRDVSCFIDILLGFSNDVIHIPAMVQRINTFNSFSHVMPKQGSMEEH